MVAGCHCSVLWLGGRVTANFGRVDVVPLDVVPLLCAIAGCHCSVLWLGASVTTSGGGRGAMGTLHSNGIQKNCFEVLADVALFSTLIRQKLCFCYLGSMI